MKAKLLQKPASNAVIILGTHNATEQSVCFRQNETQMSELRFKIWLVNWLTFWLLLVLFQLRKSHFTKLNEKIIMNCES